MSLFFPDNDLRQVRVVELCTQAQDYLNTATNYYDTFTSSLTTVNTQIAGAYEALHLQAPPAESIQIIQIEQTATSKIGTTDTAVSVTKIISDVAGYGGCLKYLTPALTRNLVQRGLISGGDVLMLRTIPYINYTFTDAAFMAGAWALVFTAAAITVVDLGLDAWSGYEAREQLQGAIADAFPLRSQMKLSMEKTKVISDSMASLAITLNALSTMNVPVETLNNVVQKTVTDTVQRANAITADSVGRELQSQDTNNASYTADDPTAVAAAAVGA